MKKNKYIYLYVVQGNYGYGDGWEDLCQDIISKLAYDNLKDYRVNDSTGHFRIIRRRELSEEN